MHFLIEGKKGRGRKKPFDAGGTFGSVLPTLLSNLLELIQKALEEHGNGFQFWSTKAAECEFWKKLRNQPN